MERSHAVDAFFAHAHWGGMMAGWWWMWVVVAVVSIVMIAALVLILRSVASTSRDAAQHVEGAHRILAERYARGEIDTEEFEERTRVLDSLGG